jgi:hypothetical protein
VDEVPAGKVKGKGQGYQYSNRTYPTVEVPAVRPARMAGSSLRLGSAVDESGLYSRGEKGGC